jgi:hypothetical protein
VVLWALTKSPYEPMDRASIFDWSVKTAFLLAFASAKRRGELHALSMEKHDLILTKDSVTLRCEAGFLTKTQLPNQIPQPFVIPSLSKAEGKSVSGMKLCPVRAVRQYLKLTRPIRGKRKRLFIPCRGDRDLAKATLSRWIILAIRRAYRSVSSNDCTRLKVKAHEVRAVSASWAFANRVSLDQVMATASWRSHSTFSNFYLRSLASQSSDIYSLGPLVAAGRVIGPSEHNA